MDNHRMLGQRNRVRNNSVASRSIPSLHPAEADHNSFAPDSSR
jgi:hypothetical protein